MWHYVVVCVGMWWYVVWYVVVFGGMWWYVAVCSGMWWYVVKSVTPGVFFNKFSIILIDNKTFLATNKASRAQKTEGGGKGGEENIEI